jgi:hypothetical protein
MYRALTASPATLRANSSLATTVPFDLGRPSSDPLAAAEQPPSSLQQLARSALERLAPLRRPRRSSPGARCREWMLRPAIGLSRGQRLPLCQ